MSAGDDGNGLFFTTPHFPTRTKKLKQASVEKRDPVVLAWAYKCKKNHDYLVSRKDIFSLVGRLFLNQLQSEENEKAVYFSAVDNHQRHSYND